MKNKTMRNLLKILGCSLAVLLIGGCQGPLSLPKQDAPASSGRAIIKIGESGARSLVPTINPDFSKYELVFTADGKTGLTLTLESLDDRTAISNSGYAVELEEAAWSVAVSAFVSGTDSTYLEAARGAGSLTVDAANPYPSVFISLEPLVMDGEAKGIFTWNLNLDGVTGSPSVSGTITPLDSDDSITLIDPAYPVSSAPPSFNWSGNWTQTGTNKYTSNSIGDNGSTWETLTITAPNPCNITVRLSASSEAGYDYGYASRLDGSPSASDYYLFPVSGGEIRSYTYTVPAGTHRVYFGYVKDGSVNGGNDNVVVEVVQTDSTAQTLYGFTGLRELASGYYQLELTLTKGNASVGVYRVVHIYPGLSTTAEGEDFTFTDADFVEQTYIAGTVEISGVPEDKTVEWVKVRPYQEAAFTSPLAEAAATTQNGSWFFAIPAGTAGVYFKATVKLTGSVAEYDLNGGSETDLPASGKKGIALSPVYEITIPAVPTGVTAAAQSTSSIQITWNTASNAESYSLYYGTSSSSITNLLTTTTGNTYIHTGLQPNTMYYYRVTAVNSVGENTSAAVGTTTRSNGPDGVTAAAQSSSSIRISWNTVSSAYSYKVYYGTSSSSTPSLLTTTANTSYTHTGLQPGTDYYYWVTAVNSAGESAYSSVVNAITDSLVNGNSVTRLTAGSWADGNMASNDTEHWLRFTATAGTQYIHVGFGTLTDLYVQVYDDSRTIAIESRSNLSGNNGYTKNISRTLTVGEEYYIKVTPYYSSNSSRTYRIAFNTTVMPPGTSPATLNASNWVERDMDSSSNQQWFKFIATAATQYIHVGFGTLDDLYVQVYNSSVNTVGSETEFSGNNGYTKNISRTLTVGEEYYIKVRPYYSSNSSRIYRIAFNTTVMPPGTSPARLSASNWHNSDMVSSSNQQWFKFTATAATQYIHVTFGTLDDLYVQVYNSSVNTVGSETELSGNNGYTKYISRAMTIGEEYYIKVRPYYSSNSSRTYKIAFSNTLMPPGMATTTLSGNNWTEASMTTTQYGQQWFRFTATAATQYIHVSFGALTDLYVQVYDSSVNAVGNRTNLYGSTRNISRSLTIGQVYYVKVEPYRNSLGTYKIAFNTSSIAPPQ